LGRNAITDMARLILHLEKDHESLATHQHPLLGPATCNIGVISGGVQVNFVPDQCAIELDRRLLPGETIKDVLAHYENLLRQAERQIPGLTVAMEPPMLGDEALHTSADTTVTHAASSVLQSLALNGEPCGVPFGSDASKLSRTGIPSIVFGPGSIDRAHAAVEYVEIDQLELAVEFYRRFLTQFEP
jgi:acetylornithine deacetylase